MKMSAYKVLFFVILSTVMLCCHTSDAGPARQLASLAVRASKIPRSIRAPFRNSEMMTARGFGKRRAPIGMSMGSGGSVPVGKHTVVADESSPWNDDKRELGKLIEEIDGVDPVQQLIIAGEQESFPLEWFANEMSSNPVLARAILQRFVDVNRDGLLTTNELASTGASPNEAGDLF